MPFGILNISQNHIKFATLTSTLCQIVNEHFQKGQSFTTQRHSGEISPNLVTLTAACHTVKYSSLRLLWRSLNQAIGWSSFQFFKSCKIFSKVAQNVATFIFSLKVMLLRSTNIWAICVWKLTTENFQNSANKFTQFFAKNKFASPFAKKHFR